MKVSVIGAGNVGGLAAARIAEKTGASVFLIDIAPKLAVAKATDITDSLSILSVDALVNGSERFEDIKGSDIVVVTAGLARKPGMTREDLLQKNRDIINDISGYIKAYAPAAVVIVVTNPLDVMTYFMYKKLGVEKACVFGMGATLDASRFAVIISRELAKPVTVIRPCVIGSHGEGMMPLPRFTFVEGKKLTEIATEKQIESLVSQTVNRGKEIVSLYGSGSAYFAPSAAIAELVDAVAKDSNVELCVSAYLDGEYGIRGICTGVPCIIGRSGIRKIIQLELNANELAQLRSCAESTKKLASPVSA